MTEEGQEAVAQQIGGGLEAGGEEQDGRREDLVVGELIVVVAGLTQRAEQIVRRAATALRQQLREVGAQAFDGGDRRVDLVVGQHRFDPRAAARTNGWSSVRSPAGTPTNSPITAMGRGSASRA